MTQGYAYDHAWAMERVRLAGLEVALDPGTREHLTRLGAGPGKRCLEIGAGGGSVAFWLAERVAPGGAVVATDLETGFLESEAAGHPGLEVLRHDITAQELPGGFDVVHTRWLVEWLPDKPLALRRMASALRPGGVLLIEEPDFVTIYGAGEPPALRHVIIAAMAHLESTCPIVHGGSPLAAGFLRLTIEKLREPVLAAGAVSEDEFAQAVAALQDPGTTVVAPMTVAAWGRRP